MYRAKNYLSDKILTLTAVVTSPEARFSCDFLVFLVFVPHLARVTLLPVLVLLVLARVIVVL